MQSKMKILVLGPSGVGKTVLSNIISDHSETPSSVYHPTAGVRILEFEKDPPRSNRRAGESAVNIELWDCSGDPRYEKCWNAFRKDAVGIIFVYDAEDPNPDMNPWVRHFLMRMRIPTNQCIAMAHSKSSSSKKTSKPPMGLERIAIHETSLESSQNIRLAFEKLFGFLYSSLAETQEREENELFKI